MLETHPGSELVLGPVYGGGTRDKGRSGVGEPVHSVGAGGAVVPVSTLAATPLARAPLTRGGGVRSRPIRDRPVHTGSSTNGKGLAFTEPHEGEVPASSSFRRGKAPPVDSFSGESPDIPFEDWLPALQRAAEWNGWSKSETLIQLGALTRSCSAGVGITLCQ